MIVPWSPFIICARLFLNYFWAFKYRKSHQWYQILWKFRACSYVTGNRPLKALSTLAQSNFNQQPRELLAFMLFFELIRFFILVTKTRPLWGVSMAGWLKHVRGVNICSNLNWYLNHEWGIGSWKSSLKTNYVAPAILLWMQHGVTRNWLCYDPRLKAKN